MPTTMGHTRRVVLLFTLAIIAGLIFITSFRSAPVRDVIPQRPLSAAGPATHNAELSQASLTGHAIAPKLGNETLKAELGRSAWHLFHTVMARFPEEPTTDEQEALRSYVHLFQRLYPCGECATHFGEILRNFPPQVSSRNAASGWGCMVHNEVNESLGKAEFDCSKIGDWYDCGCGDDEPGEASRGVKEIRGMSSEDVEIATGVI